MKLLRALDSAATAFFNELWPIPEPLDDFDEEAAADYLIDLGRGAITTDKPLTPETRRKIENAWAQVDRILSNLPAGDPGPGDPPLTDDEIVAVRQLIEERFPLLTAPADGEASGSPPAGDAPRVAPTPSVDDAGRPIFTADELRRIDYAIRAWINHIGSHLSDPVAYVAIAQKAHRAAEALAPTK